MREKYSYGYALDCYKQFKDKEKEFERRLKVGNYYIMRFDGKGMTADFKVKKLAINQQYFDIMKETFYQFVKMYPKIVFAYSFSDEVSILFKASKDDDFSRMQKLLSLLSSQLSVCFNKVAAKCGIEKEAGWIFDARIINVTWGEALDYFRARQAFAIDKFIMQTKGEYGINFKLNKSSEVLKALSEIGIDYNNFENEKKYGLVYSFNKEVNAFEFDDNIELLKQLCFGKKKLKTSKVGG